MVINVSGTYTLKPDASWAEVNLNEIRLLCDTSLAPVIINLPEIATTGIANYNITIIVADNSQNAATNNITINSAVSDKIGSETQQAINVDGGAVSLKVATQDNWLAETSSEMSGGGVSLVTEEGGIYVTNQLVVEEIKEEGIKKIFSSQDQCLIVESLNAKVKKITLSGLTEMIGGFVFYDVSDNNNNLEEINFPDLVTLGAQLSQMSGGFNVFSSDGTGLKKISFPKLKEIIYTEYNTGFDIKSMSPVFEGANLPELTTLKCSYGGTNQAQIGFTASCIGGVNMPKFSGIDGTDGSANGASVFFGMGNSNMTGDITIGTKATPFDIVNCDGGTYVMYTDNVVNLKSYLRDFIGASGATVYIYMQNAVASVDISTLRSVGLNGTIDIGIDNITTLDLSALTTVGDFSIQNLGASALTSITFGSSIAVGNFFDLSGLSLDQATINSALIALDNGGESNKTVDLSGGTNAAPSGAGATAAANLVSKGWTVTTN